MRRWQRPSESCAAARPDARGGQQRRLVARFGRQGGGKWFVAITFGTLLFGTVVELGTDYWVFATVFVVLGLGMGLTMAPSTGLVMNLSRTTSRS